MTTDSACLFSRDGTSAATHRPHRTADFSAAKCLIGGRWLRLIWLTLALFGVAACASVPLGDTVNDKPFVSWYTGMAQQVKANPDYHKIPLDTDAKAHAFIQWLHALYRQQITAAQFEQNVANAYPGHDYEARYIVQCLPPVSERPAP
jgi:hypothetical protein